MSAQPPIPASKTQGSARAGGQPSTGPGASAEPPNPSRASRAHGNARARGQPLSGHPGVSAETPSAGEVGSEGVGE